MAVSFDGYSRSRSSDPYLYVKNSTVRKVLPEYRGKQERYRDDSLEWQDKYFVPFQDRVTSLVATADRAVEGRFLRLMNEWKEQSLNMSSPDRMAMLPPYLGIIGMGQAAVPLILREIKKCHDHWFIALMAITQENPVPPGSEGNVGAMSEAWLKWGEKSGYV